MSSIIDSVKLVFGDTNAYIKMPVAGAILYFGYRAYQGDFSQYADKEIISSVIGLIILGYMLQILNNSLQEKTYIIPNLNPFPAIWYSLKGILSCSVFSLPAYYFHTWFIKNYDAGSTLMHIYGAIGYSVTISILLGSIIFYAKDFHILQGFNIIEIIKKIPSLLIYLIISSIVLAIVNVITAVPILGMTYGLFGYGKIYEYVVCLIIVVNLMVVFQCLSHTYFEQIKVV